VFTIPDKGEGQNDLQSIIFQEAIDILVAGIAGSECVLSGCDPAAQGSPDMTVAVAKGAVLSQGVLFAVAAANATIGTADATNPRIDLVVITSAGAIATRAGTAASAPKPPARTAGDVVLAFIYVPATDTTIASIQITDARMIRSQGPIVLKKTTTAVTNNTTSSIQTYFTLTVPNGLFLTGRQIRVRCGGNYLANSGTPTWTLTIAYGGTTMFADATGATTADADRGSWEVDFILNASGNATQTLSGLVTFQTPGAKTAAATGGGDLAVTTNIATPIRGTAAVDSNAANRDLTVQWTMSVSNAADETVMEYAFAELL